MVLYFATNNKNKFNEVKEILSKFDIRQAKLDLPELQGTPESVAKKKAECAFKLLKKPVFVDDTGLSFNALNGMPGIYIKHFLSALKPEGLYQLISHYKDKSASAFCTIGYCDSKEARIFVGKCKGSIVKPSGTYFGWDPVFQPEGFRETFATLKVKNKISHRKKAMDKFSIFLSQK